MLMDEPFGAIDPINRDRLQNEFLRLQQEIRKTVVFVTHDIDEAIKMGDRIAVMQKGGKLAQYATPAELLSDPASDFVEDFVGADRGLKRLALERVRDVDLWRAPLVRDGEQPPSGQYDLDYPLVVDEAGRPMRWLSGSRAEPLIELDDILRDALSAMLEEETQYAPVVDKQGAVAGVLSIEIIGHQLQQEARAVILAQVEIRDRSGEESCVADNGFCPEWIVDNFDRYVDPFWDHVYLTVVAVAIGFAVAFALALLAYRRRWLIPPIVNVTAILYTIPSLAAFFLLLPVTGRGTTTALIVLVAYTLLILFRNTLAGLDNVPEDAKDAGRGMGLTQRQLLWKVELPLAVPEIVAGLRVAATTHRRARNPGVLRGRRRPRRRDLRRHQLQVERRDGRGPVRAARRSPRRRPAARPARHHTLEPRMNEFVDAIEFIFQSRETNEGVVVGGSQFFELAVDHMWLSFVATVIACAVAIPLGLWLGHIGRFGFLAINVSNVGRAVPSLALIAFFVAYLGVGFANVTLALVLLAIPPILTNTYVGVRQVERDSVDAAQGMGMTGVQTVRRVELPLAIPLIFGGIRTSAVNVVATATLAPLAGLNSLGDPIINVSTYGDDGRLGAAILVAFLAVATDLSLAALQRAVTPKGLRRRRTRMKQVRYATALIAVLLAALALGACGDDDDDDDGGNGGTDSGAQIQRDEANAGTKITVGSKNFTEQKILGEIYAQGLEAAGYDVDKQLNLGDEKVALKALEEGEIDAYPEYTGTALLSLFGVASDEIPLDPAAAFEDTRPVSQKEGLVAYPPTPFTNSNEVGLTQGDGRRARDHEDLRAGGARPGPDALRVAGVPPAQGLPARAAGDLRARLQGVRARSRRPAARGPDQREGRPVDRVHDRPADPAGGVRPARGRQADVPALQRHVRRCRRTCADQGVAGRRRAGPGGPDGRGHVGAERTRRPRQEDAGGGRRPSTCRSPACSRRVVSRHG